MGPNKICQRTIQRLRKLNAKQNRGRSKKKTTIIRTTTTAAVAATTFQPNFSIRWYQDMMCTIILDKRDLWWKLFSLFFILNFQSLAHFWLIHHKIENSIKRLIAFFFHQNVALLSVAPFSFGVMLRYLFVEHLSQGQKQSTLESLVCITSSIVVVYPLLSLFLFMIFSFPRLLCMTSSSLHSWSRVTCFGHPFLSISIVFSLLLGVESAVYFYSFVRSALITLHVRVRFKWLDTHNNSCARISFSSGHTNSYPLIFIHCWWTKRKKKNRSAQEKEQKKTAATK